jgi:hypothetical protein
MPVQPTPQSSAPGTLATRTRSPCTTCMPPFRHAHTHTHTLPHTHTHTHCHTHRTWSTTGGCRRCPACCPPRLTCPPSQRQSTASTMCSSCAPCWHSTRPTSLRRAPSTCWWLWHSCSGGSCAAAVGMPVAWQAASAWPPARARPVRVSQPLCSCVCAPARCARPARVVTTNAATWRSTASLCSAGSPAASTRWSCLAHTCAAGSPTARRRCARRAAAWRPPRSSAAWRPRARRRRRHWAALRRAAWRPSATRCCARSWARCSATSA